MTTTDPIKFNKELFEHDLARAVKDCQDSGLDADTIAKIIEHAERSFNELFKSEGSNDNGRSEGQVSDRHHGTIE